MDDIRSRNLNQWLVEASYRLETAFSNDPTMNKILLPRERVVFHGDPFLRHLEGLLYIGHQPVLAMDEIVRLLKGDRVQQVRVDDKTFVQITDQGLDLIYTTMSMDLMSATPYNLSVLQEYLACRVGVRVGSLYLLIGRPFGATIELAAKATAVYKEGVHHCPYSTGRVRSTKMVSTTHIDEWHQDLEKFVDNYTNFYEKFVDNYTNFYKTPEFYDHHSIRLAYRSHNDGRFGDALQQLTALPKDSDIRLACEEHITCPQQ